MTLGTCTKDPDFGSFVGRGNKRVLAVSSERTAKSSRTRARRRRPLPSGAYGTLQLATLQLARMSAEHADADQSADKRTYVATESIRQVPPAINGSAIPRPTAALTVQKTYGNRVAARRRASTGFKNGTWTDVLDHWKCCQQPCPPRSPRFRLGASGNYWVEGGVKGDSAIARSNCEGACPYRWRKARLKCAGSENPHDRDKSVSVPS